LFFTFWHNRIVPADIKINFPAMVKVCRFNGAFGNKGLCVFRHAFIFLTSYVQRASADGDAPFKIGNFYDFLLTGIKNLLINAPAFFNQATLKTDLKKA